MYYKGCIIKDGKIPMSDYSLTEEGLENILKHQDIPEVTDIYINRLSLDVFDTRYRLKDPETVNNLRITRYFKAEEAYAKKNQTTDNGSN